MKPGRRLISVLLLVAVAVMQAASGRCLMTAAASARPAHQQQAHSHHDASRDAPVQSGSHEDVPAGTACTMTQACSIVAPHLGGVAGSLNPSIAEPPLRAYGAKYSSPYFSFEPPPPRNT
jgi:hypothetical protein